MPGTIGQRTEVRWSGKKRERAGWKEFFFFFPRSSRVFRENIFQGHLPPFGGVIFFSPFRLPIFSLSSLATAATVCNSCLCSSNVTLEKYLLWELFGCRLLGKYICRRYSRAAPLPSLRLLLKCLPPPPPGDSMRCVRTLRGEIIVALRTSVRLYVRT